MNLHGNPKPTKAQMKERVNAVLHLLKLGFWSRKEAYAAYIELEKGKFSKIPYSSFMQREWRRANKMVAKKIDRANNNLATNVMNSYLHLIQVNMEAQNYPAVKAVLDSIVKFKGLAAADKVEISGKIKGQKGIPFEMWKDFDKKVREKRASK